MGSEGNPFPEPEFAKAPESEVADVIVIGTMASEFKEYGSERKSTSALLDEVGAAAEVDTKMK